MSRSIILKDLTQMLVNAESEIKKLQNNYKSYSDTSIAYIFDARSKINNIILGKNGRTIEYCKFEISLAKILAYQDVVRRKVNTLKGDVSTFSIFVIPRENRDKFSKIESDFKRLNEDIINYRSYDINKENKFISDVKYMISELEDLDNKIMNDKKEKSIKISLSFIIQAFFVATSIFALTTYFFHISNPIFILSFLCLSIVIVPVIIIYFFVRFRKAQIKNFLKVYVPFMIIIVLLGYAGYNLYILNNTSYSYKIPEYAFPYLGIQSPNQINCKTQFNATFSVENKGTVPLQITYCLATFSGNAFIMFNTTILQANETSNKTFNLLSPEKAGYYDVLLLCSFNQTNIFYSPGIQIITVNC